MTECRCRWCGNAFMPRTSGGKPQTFCRPAHRRAYDRAGRQYVASALADGTLILDALRNRHAATPALLLAGISPAPMERGADAAELLDELLRVLLSLPEVAWLRATRKMPAELFERLDRWIEARLA
jgi:hypothetical protein